LKVGDLPQVLKINIQLPRTCSHALAPPFGGGLLDGGGMGGAAGSVSISFDDALPFSSSNFSTSLNGGNPVTVWGAEAII
jgi:hypothetical protein